MEISKSLKEQIYFVIPAFNESKSISKVLNELLEQGYSKIIVIDDGSKDDTFHHADKFSEKGVISLKHIINRGQGAALKTGIQYALKQKDCKYICTFDSDGQHRLSDLPKFIGQLEKNACDIALGSRFLKKETSKLVPRKKIVLLKLSLIATYFFSGIRLSDSHNGYRVMNKKAAEKIDISMDQFEHASEILDEIAKKNIPYKEVPVFIDYTEYSMQKGQKISNSIKIFMKMVFKN